MAANRIIEDEWRSFVRQVMPIEAPEIQRIEMRKAFFAGAMSLFHALLARLDPGTEPTEADLARMSSVAEELKEYRAELGRGVGRL